MARQYGHEKLKLDCALELIAGGDGNGYDEIVTLIAERFACSRRAAKDALSILKSAGYVEPKQNRADRRRRSYRVTGRGRRVLGHASGELLLRFARKLLTTCPSRRGLARQRALAESGGLEETLEDAERLLLHFGRSLLPVYRRTQLRLFSA